MTQSATAFLVTQYGFERERQCGSEYILSWYRALEEKPEVLGLAIREAMKVIRYVHKDNPLSDFSEYERDNDHELRQVA